MSGNLSLDIVNFLIAGMGFTSIVVGCAELLSRKKTVLQYISFFLYSIWGFMIFIDCINHTPLFSSYPYFAYANDVIELLLGALFYHYFKVLFIPNAPLRSRSLLMYIPALVGLVLYLPFYVQSPDFKRMHYPSIKLGDAPLETVWRFVNHYGELWVIFCLVLFLWRLHFIFRRKKTGEASPEFARQRYMVIIYCAAFSAVMILFIYVSLLQLQVFQRIAVLLSCILACFLFFFRYRYGEVLASMRRELSEITYRKSRITGIDVHAVTQRLADLMTEEHLYASEGLTLNSLSQRLSLSPHQLSEILNTELNTGFRNFVNGYRLAAAKKMLEESDENILSIAFKCGFNSKTAFNSAFASETGLTPRAYRDGIGKKGGTSLTDKGLPGAGDGASGRDA
jgi:AraC-like DNA-binding protein